MKTLTLRSPADRDRSLHAQLHLKAAHGVGASGDQDVKDVDQLTLPETLVAEVVATDELVIESALCQSLLAIPSFEIAAMRTGIWLLHPTSKDNLIPRLCNQPCSANHSSLHLDCKSRTLKNIFFGRLLLFFPRSSSSS